MSCPPPHPTSGQGESSRDTNVSDGGTVGSCQNLAPPPSPPGGSDPRGSQDCAVLPQPASIGLAQRSDDRPPSKSAALQSEDRNDSRDDDRKCDPEVRHPPMKEKARAVNTPMAYQARKSVPGRRVRYDLGRWDGPSEVIDVVLAGGRGRLKENKDAGVTGMAKGDANHSRRLFYFMSLLSNEERYGGPEFDAGFASVAHCLARHGKELTLQLIDAMNEVEGAAPASQLTALDAIMRLCKVVRMNVAHVDNAESLMTYISSQCEGNIRILRKELVQAKAAVRRSRTKETFEESGQWADPARFEKLAEFGFTYAEEIERRLLIGEDVGANTLVRATNAVTVALGVACHTSRKGSMCGLSFADAVKVFSEPDGQRFYSSARSKTFGSSGDVVIDFNGPRAYALFRVYHDVIRPAVLKKVAARLIPTTRHSRDGADVTGHFFLTRDGCGVDFGRSFQSFIAWATRGEGSGGGGLRLGLTAFRRSIATATQELVESGKMTKEDGDVIHRADNHSAAVAVSTYAKTGPRQLQVKSSAILKSALGVGLANAVGSNADAATAGRKRSASSVSESGGDVEGEPDSGLPNRRPMEEEEACGSGAVGGDLVDSPAGLTAGGLTPSGRLQPRATMVGSPPGAVTGEANAPEDDRRGKSLQQPGRVVERPSMNQQQQPPGQAVVARPGSSGCAAEGGGPAPSELVGDDDDDDDDNVPLVDIARRGAGNPGPKAKPKAKPRQQGSLTHGAQGAGHSSLGTKGVRDGRPHGPNGSHGPQISSRDAQGSTCPSGVQVSRGAQRPHGGDRAQPTPASTGAIRQPGKRLTTRLKEPSFYSQVRLTTPRRKYFKGFLPSVPVTPPGTNPRRNSYTNTESYFVRRAYVKEKKKLPGFKANDHFVSLSKSACDAKHGDRLYGVFGRRHLEAKNMVDHAVFAAKMYDWDGMHTAEGRAYTAEVKARKRAEERKAEELEKIAIARVRAEERERKEEKEKAEAAEKKKKDFEISALHTKRLAAYNARGRAGQALSRRLFTPPPVRRR